MAVKITLKLTNRSPKQPVKNLPSSIEVPANSTIEDVKILVARNSGIRDFNRLGIYDPTTKKTVKNRKALVSDVEGVASAGEVLVKDMGPQIGWRNVYMIEYAGPILFHLLFVAARPLIYSDTSAGMSQTQWLTFFLIVLHYLKREYETIFVHRFSANTMPVRNVFKNSAFYWIISGIFCSYFLYHPRSLTATAGSTATDAIGVALYLFGEAGTGLVHYYLSTLRSPGGTERKIPSGYGFAIVTCPNYMYEVIAWVGVIVASLNWSIVLFIFLGGVQMYDWAKGKERAYRKEFGDKYKKKRYVMLPGLL